MKKYLFRKSVGRVSSEAKKEGANARKAVKGLVGLVSETWDLLIGMIPKMIRLSIELVKSDKVGSKVKLILIGTICVAGFAIAEEFINRFTVFPIVFLLLGPFSAIASIAFFGTIKFLLLVACFFITAHVYNTAIENEEVNKLADTVFGEKDGKQFLSDLEAIYQRLNKYLSPFADKLMIIFEKIGRKKKDLDPESAGDIVIRAAKDNMPILLRWSGSLQAEAMTLLSELDKAEKDPKLCADVAIQR